MMEKVAEREMKKQEREKKLSLERSKKALERKKIEEDKFERIREAERNYKMQLLEGREKMDQKLEEARKKAEEEAEQRRKKLAEREQMNEMKRQQVLGRKEKLDIQELKMTDELKSKISQKIMKAEETHQDSLNIIKTKIKLQLQRGGSVGKIRRTQTQESSEFIQSFVDKTLKREDSLQAFKIKCYKDVKKKEADSLAKEQRFFSNQMNLQEKQEEKNKVMNDKFTKMQESIEAKRESDEKNRKVKQELNRLKLADKLENHIRMDRRIQFEKLKILDKEKKEQERVFWSKCQKEIAQKAKLEVSVQAKIQRDKIDEGINQLVKKVYEANSSQTVTEVQKKILKSILQPEDYEFIEGKEIKKEEERQKELEKQERGDDRSRSPSPSRKNR